IMSSARFITFRFLCSLLVAGFALMPTQAQEKLPPNAKLVRVEAAPASIELKTPFAYSQLVLTGQLDNGDRVDVTRLAQISKPVQVKVTPNGLVRPAAEGGGELRCSIEGKTVIVPVKVSGQKDQYDPSFVRDIMPTMSKMGWNAGACP